VFFLHFDRSSTKTEDRIPDQILMLLVVGLVLSAKGKDDSAYLGSGELVGRDAIRPDAPVLEEECPVQDLDVVKLVCFGHVFQRGHWSSCVFGPIALRETQPLDERVARGQEGTCGCALARSRLSATSASGRQVARPGSWRSPGGYSRAA